MAIQIIQKPSDIQPAQSPIVFSVITSGSELNAYTASEFQYTANLYVWDNTPASSGSYIYQARKYPNQSGSGIFDFSRMINSTLIDLAATNISNIKYYKVDFGFQYASGSTYVTQSGALTPVTCSAGGTLFKAYDGYAIFPDTINDSLYGQNIYWPIMSDAGAVTQSVTATDKSAFGASYPHGLSIWVGPNDVSKPTAISCSVIYENGTTAQAVYDITSLTGLTNTSSSIAHLPSAPNDSNWSTYWPSSTSMQSYKFTAFTGSVQMGQPFNFIVECAHYYEPVRIAFKNRYGQFDFLNFYKRHNETFNTDQRLYQPQLGTWGAAALSYDQFQTSQQRYIVDATQTLECNTNWLEQGYNELMKQMMVSDEIYWMYDQTNNLVKPLTIQTNSLQFKTGVNNKLIQYTIVFDIGQPYKLLL
jgi:hypothetical protein